MGIVVKKKTDLIAPGRRRAGIKVSPRTERTYKPTKSELAAIKKGEAEIARDEYVPLSEFQP